MNMEQILEMNEANQLIIPASFVETMNLKPGAHFVARDEAGRLVIEYLPFSSFEQRESLDKTIHSLQKE
jgi:bifunctional DNA-binding transcriptional regulator/antitoxin component of YhaV-PrlF toxin-antitoxin module